MQKYFLGLVFALTMVISFAAPQQASAASWHFCAHAAVGGDTSGGFGAIFGGSLVYGDACPATTGGIGGNPYGLPSGSIYNIVATIVGWLLAMFGLLGIFGFVVSGIMYLLAAGEEDMAKKAKKGLMYSIIGIIVGLSGYVIMQAVSGLLSGVGGTGY